MYIQVSLITDDWLSQLKESAPRPCAESMQFLFLQGTAVEVSAVLHDISVRHSGAARTRRGSSSFHMYALRSI